METGSGVNDSGTVTFDTEKENIMDKDFDQAKGKVKQALGDLTGTRISGPKVRPTGRLATSRSTLNT